MIHYTKLESKDHGLLMFKVIGASSREEAQKATCENWGECLMQGRTLDGPLTICPLFCNLTSKDNTMGRIQCPLTLSTHSHKIDRG